MHNDRFDPWQHEHSFGQEHKRPGEARTIVVIVITATMMVVEIAAGIAFGSMALLADGLHMASHAGALSVSVFAYIYARRHAHDNRYSFGTGKVNALGGFTGAILLGLFAVIMVAESIERFISPVDISFDEAIGVAVLGLVVNGTSMFILGHGHESKTKSTDDSWERPEQKMAHAPGQHDQNLRAAYFHVLADALTSILAIFALLAGKYLRLVWMDPLMGIVGAVLVARWSLGLSRVTCSVLLDRQAPKFIRDAVRESLEAQGAARVTDLHVWSIGPNIYAAEIVVVTGTPQPPDYYKTILPSAMGLEHVTVEVHHAENQLIAAPQRSGADL